MSRLLVDPTVEPGGHEHSDLWSRWPLRGRAVLEFVASFVLLAVAGLTAGWMMLGPLAGSAIAEWDRDVATSMANARTPALDTLTDLGSAFSDTVTIVVALVVLMVAMTFFWRRWREPLTLGVALGLEASVFLAVSSIIGRDRPPVEQLDPSPPTASFPSGHTGAAFAFYIGLAVIVYWVTQRWAPRAIAILAAALIPIAVALSRMYRGMHYITDVLAGAALGIACLVAAVSIVQRAIHRRKADTS